MSIIEVQASGELFYKGKEYCCALGKNGVAKEKYEGDGKTPEGSFPLRKVLYRPDRLQAPETKLPLIELKQDSGWCDDPADPSYNSLVELPYPTSSESLWREDDIYDVIVVIGYNDDPPLAGKGSAIFMHIARENYSPTEGCVALAKNDLLEILKDLDASTLIHINA